jgi:hypothetical protein
MTCKVKGCKDPVYVDCGLNFCVLHWSRLREETKTKLTIFLSMRRDLDRCLSKYLGAAHSELSQKVEVQ